MSRKKKQGNNPAGLIILLLGWLIFLLSVLASAVIWLGWLACEILYARHSRTPDETDILRDEKEEHELAENQARIRAIDARLERIEIEGRQLRRRKDGLFHAGSTLGASLNAEIARLIEERSDCQAISRELWQLPQHRLQEWSAPLARLLGFRWATAAYVAGLAYGAILAPSSALLLHRLVLRNLGEYLPTLSFPLYGAMALASIVAACAGGAAYVLYSHFIRTHYSAQLNSH